MPNFTARMSDDDIKALDGICHEQLRSRSEMLAFMIRKWVADHAEAKPTLVAKQTTKPKTPTPPMPTMQDKRPQAIPPGAVFGDTWIDGGVTWTLNAHGVPVTGQAAEMVALGLLRASLNQPDIVRPVDPAVQAMLEQEREQAAAELGAIVDDLFEEPRNVPKDEEGNDIVPY